MLNRSPRAGAGAALRGAASFPRAAAGRGAGSTVTNGCSSSGASAARRRGHHQRQARILEADGARAGRHLDVESAGNDAVRVDVSTMMSTVFQQIDPQAVEPRLAAEIERAILGERGGVAGQQFGEVGESRVALRQIVERGIAGVAGIAMVAAPALPGAIVLGERADRMRRAQRATLRRRYRRDRAASRTGSRVHGRALRWPGGGERQGCVDSERAAD